MFLWIRWYLSFKLPMRFLEMSWHLESSNNKDTETLISEGPGTRFTYKFWAQNSNLVKTCDALSWTIMIWSGHNFAHVTTAELSWHVRNHDMIRSLKSKLEQNEIFRKFNYELIDCLWKMIPAVVKWHHRTRLVSMTSQDKGMFPGHQHLMPCL